MPPTEIAAADIRQQLVAAFCDQPAAAGSSHPIADQLTQWLNNPETRYHILTICANPWAPHLARHTLTVMATIKPDWCSEGQRADLMRQCLASPSWMIRDAGIGLAEQWRTPVCVRLLAEHRDHHPETEAYRQAVTQDLRDENLRQLRDLINDAARHMAGFHNLYQQMWHELRRAGCVSPSITASLAFYNTGERAGIRAAIRQWERAGKPRRDDTATPTPPA